jgi:hypothetical protein
MSLTDRKILLERTWVITFAPRSLAIYSVKQQTNIYAHDGHDIVDIFAKII